MLFAFLYKSNTSIVLEFKLKIVYFITVKQRWNYKKGNYVTVDSIFFLCVGWVGKEKILSKVILLSFFMFPMMISCGKRYFLYLRWQRVELSHLGVIKTIILSYQKMIERSTFCHDDRENIFLRKHLCIR